MDHGINQRDAVNSIDRTPIYFNFRRMTVDEDL